MKIDNGKKREPHTWTLQCLASRRAKIKNGGGMTFSLHGQMRGALFSSRVRGKKRHEGFVRARNHDGKLMCQVAIFKCWESWFAKLICSTVGDSFFLFCQNYMNDKLFYQTLEDAPDNINSTQTRSIPHKCTHQNLALILMEMSFWDGEGASCVTIGLVRSLAR